MKIIHYKYMKNFEEPQLESLKRKRKKPLTAAEIRRLIPDGLKKALEKEQEYVESKKISAYHTF